MDWKHQPWGTGGIGLLGPASSCSVVTNFEFFNLAAASSAPSLECISSLDGRINLLHLEDFCAAGTTAASSLHGRPTLCPWDPASDLFLEPHGCPTGRFVLSGCVLDFIMPAFPIRVLARRKQNVCASYFLNKNSKSFQTQLGPSSTPPIVRVPST